MDGEQEEWADTFGGEGAPQNVVAAIDPDATVIAKMLKLDAVKR